MDKKVLLPPIPTVENVDAGFLFISDDYEVKRWAFDFSKACRNSTGFNDCFCFTMVREGNFLFDVAPRKNDMHTGHIIVEKANIEYSLRPSSGCCTIFNFSDGFYRGLVEDYNLHHSFFFSNRNLVSLVMQTVPEIEYLHYVIVKRASKAGRLEMDNLVFELVKQIVFLITNAEAEVPLNSVLLKFHLGAVEKAKIFINEHFSNDISLKDIAQNAHTSVFHFSRIFKQATGLAPHRYLTAIRLKHAELLLKNTQLPVKDVGYSSGFLNADYFSYAFKRKYCISPAAFKAGKNRL